MRAPGRAAQLCCAATPQRAACSCTNNGPTRTPSPMRRSSMPCRMRICALRGNVKKVAQGVPACSSVKPCKVGPKGTVARRTQRTRGSVKSLHGVAWHCMRRSVGWLKLSMAQHKVNRPSTHQASPAAPSVATP